MSEYLHLMLHFLHNLWANWEKFNFHFLLIPPTKLPLVHLDLSKADFRLTQKMKQNCSKAMESQNHSTDPGFLKRFVS